MASVSRGSLRTAVFVCAPSIARFHERLAEALSTKVNVPGDPRGTYDYQPLEGGWDESLSSRAIPYLFSEVLSKFDDGKPNLEKEVATWSRFHEAEALCAKANHELRRIDSDETELCSVIKLTQSMIRRILRPFNWDQAAHYFAWGPGSTTRLPRRKSDAAHKFAGTPHTTKGNAALAHACIRMSPAWEKSLSPYAGEDAFGHCKVVVGNRVVTVPKNYKTDRTIAIEPDMNIYVQKGIGGLMRKRLKDAGCDLDDQTRNQRLARVGSISGALATIDLSMASDCLSRKLVELLLPADWLMALEQSRSPFGVLPSGEKIFYQKFSSMGNGYTFELESLIFYSLAKAYCHIRGVSDDRVSVYGDDIIIPNQIADLFMCTLERLGFQPNYKKSHVGGYFRESCGKHYFHGHDVTPFYVKKQPKTLMDLFLLHNKVYRYASRATWLDDRHVSGLRDLCTWLRSFAPAKWRRPRLPDGYGDGAFIGSFEECMPSRARDHIDGYAVRCMIDLVDLDVDFQHPSLLVKALSTLSKRKNTGPSTLLIKDMESRETSADLSESAQRMKKAKAASISAYPHKGTKVKQGVILVERFAAFSPFAFLESEG
jgi:hypothetical protein